MPQAGFRSQKHAPIWHLLQTGNGIDGRAAGKAELHWRVVLNKVQARTRHPQPAFAVLIKRAHRDVRRCYARCI
ncbi:MAG TPA: hypothetical protein VK604_06635, partial [Bryobacteraceae bacterium]|nr:hypothetical protein [Bryobacteraceae bacterium]